MSCAACSARVEKAVSQLEGVTSCSVSLLTNSMGVEGSADSEKIIAAVEAAGYGASLKTADKKEKHPKPLRFQAVTIKKGHAFACPAGGDTQI